MRTKVEAERQIRETIEKSGGELDICPRCRGTGFDFQHPEERAEWKKVRPEDKEGEYCMITEY